MFINDVSVVANSGRKTHKNEIIWNVCVEEEDGEESIEMTFETMIKMRSLLDAHLKACRR